MIFRALSAKYGWTPTQISEMTWPQVTMYMHSDGNEDFDSDGKMKPRKGNVRFTGPDAEIEYRQWRIANGFGG